jgi:ADP-heptose:LPS heptosyltransferase
LPLKSPIGWMAKNEIRTAALYGKTQPPPGVRALTNGYLHRMPRGIAVHGSVLGTMANVCGVPVGDFRMPIAPEWREKADALLARLNPSKPLMVYRPTVAIWEANRLSSLAKVARNPDLNAYHALVSAIRDRFFVVSLADLNQGVEWVVGPQIQPDAEFHHGELDFETMAALTERADLVFTSPCFMTVLAQAVSTPMICVFGGFEGKDSFSAGARYSPWLPIEPINPCVCWQYTCTHDKTIDLPLAHERIETFLEALQCKSC